MKHLIALLVCACFAFAQAPHVPHGPARSVEVVHDGQTYTVRWQQVRAVCASHQANDCESRVLRVEVTVSRNGALISRKHRVCETPGCKEEDPGAFVRAALHDKAKESK
jgi:hypothetical protein